VESQPLISNVGGKMESQKEERNITAVIKKKNYSGMSHLLLQLFNRTHILIFFITLEFITILKPGL